MDDYTYRGARALVLLHEREMRSFLATWGAAKAAGVVFPPTENPTYQSLETVLRHVFRAARGYMIWICEQLDLPDPEIRETPEPEELERAAPDYLEHVLERWRLPLRDVTEELVEQTEARSRWGATYTLDAMLEHAVMHPIRHAFQLRERIDAR
ncbi:MAG: hypothetical protein AAF682_01875 [Planctomycetota bacterium]